PPTLEPKQLSSVISPEELEITIDTLRTLAQYPTLIKSKACQPLRAATYDFRTVCTTGLNSAPTISNANTSASSSSLTSRVSAALADGRYMEARVALAEMRVRGLAPKLGALCRWVRDLDVVSGLSGDQGIHGRGTRSSCEREAFRALDAVLRVTCPIDETTSVTGGATGGDMMINLQPAWNLRVPSTEDGQSRNAVKNGTLFATDQERARTASKYTLIERTPGLLRKPPNHHPALLYTSEPGAIPLTADKHLTPTLHKHPLVPNLSLISSVLSPSECRAIVMAGEAVGFVPDAPLKDDTDDVSILAHNFYWVVDQPFHDALWALVRDFVPAHVGGRVARGINRRFRVYRYVPGAEYRCHIDGAWPPSGISPTGQYQYDASGPETGGKQSSLFTFLIYLNEDFQGGETTFFLPSVKEGVLNAYPVKPVMGGVALFPHGDSKGALLHEGTGVRSGAKYVIRTDVEYDVEPS
ncbi:alpha subunit of prolyl 4-hydroxylase, partial [Westerdykella ornata]